MEQQQTAGARERWEYHIEFVPTRPVSGVLTPAHQAQLDQFGADGWELVAVMQGYGQEGAQGMSLVFKRRVMEEHTRKRGPLPEATSSWPS